MYFLWRTQKEMRNIDMMNWIWVCYEFDLSPEERSKNMKRISVAPYLVDSARMKLSTDKAIAEASYEKPKVNYLPSKSRTKATERMKLFCSAMI